MPTKKPTQTTPKETKQRPKHNAKTMKAFELMDKDVSPRDAHRIATGIDNPTTQSVCNLRNKYDKHLLSQEPVVKLASKVYLETMRMKPVKTKEIKECLECKGKKVEGSVCVTCNDTGIVRTLLYPSHTNRMAAAAAVMDRIDPIVKQNLNLNVNADVSPVDLSEYIAR